MTDLPGPSRPPIPEFPPSGDGPDAFPPARRKDDPILHGLLFAATLATTMVVGAKYSLSARSLLHDGLPFSLTLMGILLAHEMGHYLTSRRHRVNASLPYFIPFPVGIGTLGAIIRMRGVPRDRGVLLDIGAAGPLVGLAVALPLALIGFARAQVGAVTHAGVGEPLVRYGDSILTWLVVRVVHGALPPGVDVWLTPMAQAAWLGLFVTALNLMPAGQFDGGHIVYGLLGSKHGLISHLTFLALVTWGLWGVTGTMAAWEMALAAGVNAYALFLIVSSPRRKWKRNLLIALVALWYTLRLTLSDGYPDTAIWLIWAVLLYSFGLDHPPTRDLHRPLDLRRRLVGWFCVAIFVLTFIPRPITVIG